MHPKNKETFFTEKPGKHNQALMVGRSIFDKNLDLIKGGRDTGKDLTEFIPEYPY